MMGTADDVVDRATGGLSRVPPVLFFDLDNTLIDHSGALDRALRDVCDRWPDFLTAHDIDEALSAFERINDALWVMYAEGTITPADIRRKRFEQWFDWLGVRAGENGFPDALVASEFYMDRYATASRAYPGVLEMLEVLARRHVIGIITNGFVGAQSRKLAVSGVEKYIEHKVYSERVGHQKPHPAIFQAALQSAGASSDQALYVGDNFANDIVGAARAGLMTVWFNPLDDVHPQSPPGIRADATVHSIAELALILGAT